MIIKIEGFAFKIKEVENGELNNNFLLIFPTLYNIIQPLHFQVGK